MSRQVVRTSSKRSIRGMDINFKTGKIFVTCFDDGFIHCYNITMPITANSDIDKVRSFRGFSKPRNVLWWEERQELYVGHTGGIIAVYKLDAQTNGPICKFQTINPFSFYKSS